MRKQICQLAFSAAALALSLSGVNAQTGGNTKPVPSGYHLIKTIKVGGEGGWDYLFDDSAAHRLYVSHATKIVVIDTDTDAVIGEISHLTGVHGVAVAAGRGFISDGRANAVTMFDLKTLQTLGTVTVGKNPDSIIYDPASQTILAFNGGSSDVTILDAADGKVRGTLALGGKPEFAVADEAGTVYVNIEDKSEIVAFDPAKLKIKARWSIAPGEEPSGLAFDRKHHLLFAVCSNKKMIALNTATGRVVGDIPIGAGTDAAAFDAELKLAFSSNGEGTLTVVRAGDKNQFEVFDTVPTQRGARTMTIDSQTHKLYLATAQFGATPAPTAERPHPRPAIMPDSFVILVFGK